MRTVIFRYCLPSEPVAAVQVLELKVFRIAALVFFAAAGTESRPVVVPSVRYHAVLRGHSPE
jgi:hypothetical protein